MVFIVEKENLRNKMTSKFYFRGKYYENEYSEELSKLWKEGSVQDRADLSCALAIHLIKNKELT